MALGPSLLRCVACLLLVSMVCFGGCAADNGRRLQELPTCGDATVVAGVGIKGDFSSPFSPVTFSTCCTLCTNDLGCVAFYHYTALGQGNCQLFTSYRGTTTDADSSKLTAAIFQARANGDPVVTMFNKEKLYWSAPKGSVHNMLSSAGFALNAVIGDFSASNITGTGKHNDEWLVALGARFAENATLEITLNTMTPVIAIADDEGVIRMRMADENAGPLLTIRLNGQDATRLLGTGAMWQGPENSTVYFPPATADPVVGVLAVLRTNTFEVSIYNEDAGVYHLDFTLSILQAVEGAAVHGVLGQSWAWLEDDRSMTHVIEGEVGDYHVTDGLSGTHFKYSKFNATGYSEGRRALFVPTVQLGQAIASARFSV